MSSIPQEVVAIRGEICALCKTPCALQRDLGAQGEPCTACPAKVPRWGKYGVCANYRPPQPGLGTRLQRGIHAALDAIPMPAATRAAIKSCGGCAKRREALDRAFPGSA